jgi:hypothetical protein
MIVQQNMMIERIIPRTCSVRMDDVSTMAALLYQLVHAASTTSCVLLPGLAVQACCVALLPLPAAQRCAALDCL